MKNYNYFCDKKLLVDLKGKTVRGGLVTAISQVLTLGLQVSSTIILARILVPEDFGLVGMVGVFIAFLTLFSDFGLASAIIQKEKINHQQVSNLFWFNLIFGIILAILGVMLSGAVAKFYEDNRLSYIVIALSLNFIWTALGVEHNALLLRNMLYTTIAKIKLTAVFTSVIFAYIASILGCGYWSLIIQQISLSGITVIMLWYSCSWRPSYYDKKEKISSFVKFGGYLLGFNILNFFVRSFDRLLIGKLWGATSVGYYSNANRLLLMPITLINGPISGVVVPGLSRLQDQPARYEEFYLKALKLSCTAIFPIAFISYFYSKEIIVLLLSEKWIKSAEIFKAFSGVILAQPILNSLGWLYISSSRTKEMFQWSCIASPIIAMAFYLGALRNVEAVAYAFSITMVILIIPGLWWATRKTPVSIYKILKMVTVTALMAAIAVKTVHLIYSYLLIKHIMLHLNFLLFAAIGCSIILFASILSFSYKNRLLVKELINAFSKKYCNDNVF